MESELIKRAKTFAEQTLRQDVFRKHTYHNLEHTQDVVRAVELIGSHSDLNEDEMESATLAAWLHDIGYLNGEHDHEKAAAEKSRELLDQWGASYKKIAEVSEAILATKMPQHPKSLVSKVVCDADLHHLATDQCDEKSGKLREEWATIKGRVVTDEDWIKSSVEFMQGHKYHTPYGQTVLEAAKKKNLKRLRKQLKPEINENTFQELEEEVVRLRTKLEKEKLQKPDRGIETMFRTTSTNHLRLSEMADNKANILITINSIILSIVVSVLVRKLEEDPTLTIPTIMLVTVCLTTTVFAILATRPTISRGRFDTEDIKRKRTNLLFFGNFHNMEVENYEWAMKEMMKDADYLYGSLIKDIYYLGKVLGRKYKFLRIAYNIFMFGFVASILSFVIALMHKQSFFGAL